MTTTDKWTSTKTFEQWIEDTEATGQYDETVTGLLQEEQRGGKFEYLRGNHTLFEYDLFKRQALLAELKESLESKRKQILDLQGKMQDEKKADKRKQLETGLDSLYMERYSLEDKIKKTQELVDHLQIADHIWKGYFISLRRIVNLYKNNKNKEFLRKGVHAISTYRDYLLGDHETSIRRTFLLEKYGDVKELRALFDLEKIPLNVFYHLGNVVEMTATDKWTCTKKIEQGMDETDAKFIIEREKSKFITECCLYYKEHHPDEFLPTPVKQMNAASSLSFEEDGEEDGENHGEKEEQNTDKKCVVQEEEIESKADAAAHRDADLYSKFDRF